MTYKFYLNLKYMSSCAPGKNHTDGSCYTLESLKTIAHAYNNSLLKENYSNNKNSKFYNKETDVSNENLIKISDNREFLLKQLRTRLKDFCNDDEKCWTGLKFVRSLGDLEIEKFTFKPDAPKGQWAWLSTVNIDRVMEQYQRKYKDFKYLGTVPIDFGELPVLGIKNLSFEDLEKQGFTKFGMVINTDEHYKSGQHWIATFIDTKDKKVYFFDSVGTQPEKRVVNFLAKASKHIMSKYNIKHINDIDVLYNYRQHQFKNTECGVYSINFILRLLKGETFEEIIERRMSDNEVNKCRNVYFSKTKKESN